MDAKFHLLWVYKLILKWENSSVENETIASAFSKHNWHLFKICIIFIIYRDKKEVYEEI